MSEKTTHEELKSYADEIIAADGVNLVGQDPIDIAWNWYNNQQPADVEHFDDEDVELIADALRAQLAQLAIDDPDRWGD